MIIDDYVARVLEYWRLLSLYIFISTSPTYRPIVNCSSSSFLKTLPACNALLTPT